MLWSYLKCLLNQKYISHDYLAHQSDMIKKNSLEMLSSVLQNIYILTTTTAISLLYSVSLSPVGKILLDIKYLNFRSGTTSLSQFYKPFVLVLVPHSPSPFSILSRLHFSLVWVSARPGSRHGSPPRPSPNRSLIHVWAIRLYLLKRCQT